MKKRYSQRVRAESEAIIANFNNNCERRYSKGELLEDGIDLVSKHIGEIDWSKLASIGENVFADERYFEAVVRERAREGNRSATCFMLSEKAIRVLEEEIIPDISAYYPMLETFVRPNLAVALVLRYLALHSDCFVSPISRDVDIQYLCESIEREE